ncbi:MAG TPA: cytochrome c [Terriglobia bacterium]|nr:cytochrome c [Terriglobia bacterium]
MLSRQVLSLMGIVSLAAILAASINAQDKSDPAALYSKNCKMCHRSDGKGVPAMKTPDFTNKEWQASHPDAELIQAVTKGKDKMPAFEEKLKPEEVKAIISDVIRKFAQ